MVWLDHTGQERIVKGLEGWGSEAIVVGEDLWILRGATLSRLGADGTTLGQWEVPPGAEDLREENGIRFRVADDGLYLLKEGAKQATCTWKGQWDGSLCRDGWTFAWNADMMVARDPRGRHAWQRPDPGQLPALGDDVLFGTFRQGAQWWVMALETATGEVRWRAIREGQDEHGVLIPAGHSLGLWRLGPLEVLDVRDGKHLQTLEPPGDWFSATGPMSYRDGLLVLAADDKLVCYEAG